ncbi:MAG: hypothetical protein ACT6FD_07735 [Methanosarcinaceae archaeon]
MSDYLTETEKKNGASVSPNKKERLLAFPLLRTGLATFITSGSSLS